jgi:hypothetical protein
MSDRRESCPSCGTPGTLLLEERLCPACLLRLALDGTAEGDGPEGTSGAAGRYVVRAVMDDCAEATAYLAEDTLSGALVRLEVARQVSAGVPADRRDDPRVLDGGVTADGRAWVVTARDVFREGERRWMLGS